MARDTIAAIATPPGAAGIGIVRLSGPSSPSIASAIAGVCPTPRHAQLATFTDSAGATIDQGLVIYFPSPASFTGEDVIELHAHGSLAVLELLMHHAIALGARPARPGEFTERAFRHGKLDLAQAEAVADLIASRSARAVRSSMRTLQGEFSRRVTAIVSTLHGLRAALEASIDFPDDVPSRPPALAPVAEVRTAIIRLLASASHGARLAAGARVVIVGAPNVGKSTLLNRLAGDERAIVSTQPGTTRDVVEVDTTLAGIPLRISDTAGLRESDDDIEREGMRRAATAMASADALVLVVASPEVDAAEALLASLCDVPAAGKQLITVHNKIDLYGAAPRLLLHAGEAHVFLAAREDLGVDLLRSALVEHIGGDSAIEDEFTARRRHVVALETALGLLADIDEPLLERSPEIVADIYRRAALALAEITGEFTTEDLLGEIFSRFCLGK